jgi:hypothetical protein
MSRKCRAPSQVSTSASISIGLILVGVMTTRRILGACAVAWALLYVAASEARTRETRLLRPDDLSVLVETETVDTGERKELFGHTTCHVATTRRIIPLAGAKRGADTTVTDGWYINLNTHISCEPSWRWARSSHGFLTVHQQGEESDMPTFKDVGEPESGFAVASKRTSSGTITLPDGSTRQHVSTWETKVTELSTAPIDLRFSRFRQDSNWSNEFVRNRCRHW